MPAHKGGSGGRKIGRDKGSAKNLRYKVQGRREKNKKRRIEKEKRRQEKKRAKMEKRDKGGTG